MQGEQWARMKKRLKAGPKQYKRAPGLTGRQRLEQRAMRLVIDLYRFAQHAADPADRLWADDVLHALEPARSSRAERNR